MKSSIFEYTISCGENLFRLEKLLNRFAEFFAAKKGLENQNWRLFGDKIRFFWQLGTQQIRINKLFFSHKEYEYYSRKGNYCRVIYKI